MSEAVGERIERNIQMAWFRDGKEPGSDRKRDLVLDVLNAAKEGKGPVLCGTVFGRITGTKEKTNKHTQRDGTVIETKSNMLIGDFVATRAIDKAEIKSASVYLPGFFADNAKAAIDAGARGIDFGIEILAEKNPREGGVAYVWVLHDLLRAVEMSPLDRIRAQLKTHPLIAGSGQPLQPALPASVETKSEEPQTATATATPSEAPTDMQEVAAEATAKKPRHKAA